MYILTRNRENGTIEVLASNTDVDKITDEAEQLVKDGSSVITLWEFKGACTGVKHAHWSSQELSKDQDNAGN